jgi:thioredoxin 1
MRKSIVSISLFALVAGTAMAGSTAAPRSTPELQKTIGAAKKNTIVFFQNPMGGPCRTQNEILQRLLKERKNGFNIASVSTMKQEDQRGFYDYGVRSLPTIVLVDKNGNINRFFPPGIQSSEALAAALDAVK